MILDTLTNAQACEGLNKSIGDGLKWLRETDLAALPAGKVELNGERLFALVVDADTGPIEEKFYEAHRRYVDIQCVVTGSERQGWAPLEAMEAEPYDAEKDLQKLKGEGALFTLSAGMFAIYFPHDAHMPGVADGVPASIRKVVVKARVG